MEPSWHRLGISDQPHSTISAMNSMFPIHRPTKYLHPHNFFQPIVKSQRKCLSKKQHALPPKSSPSSNNNAMCPPILTFLASNAPLKLSRKSINSTISNLRGWRSQEQKLRGWNLHSPATLPPQEHSKQPNKHTIMSPATTHLALPPSPCQPDDLYA